MGPIEAAGALVKRPVSGTYREEFEALIYRHHDASTIACFFLRCPIDKKPSLNKAMFMIDEKGFADDELWKAIRIRHRLQL